MPVGAQNTSQLQSVQWVTPQNTMQNAVQSVLDQPIFQPSFQEATQEIQHLHTSYTIQQAVVEKFRSMDQFIQNEIRGKKRRTGKQNHSDPAETNPIIRWPNKNFSLGTKDKERPTFDYLTFMQFVWGFSKNIAEVVDMNIKNGMLNGYDCGVSKSHYDKPTNTWFIYQCDACGDTDHGKLLASNSV